MNSPRGREDTSPPVLPSEDLSGVFESPEFGEGLIGSIVAGRYTVVAFIGSGGMGCVYRAFDAANQVDVALKVLKNERVGSSQNVQRFMQEARVLSMLTHPNVVQLVDFGQDENGVLYCAMELLQGKDLADYLSEHHRMQWAEVSEIALQLVRGLQVAHERGIVHRDLKPENVFLTPGRAGGPHHVKLLDFGIAKVLTPHHSKLTTDGSVFGTARYMSPEQASGEPVDARSDVYGVGILLYEMLTGRPPFAGDDFMKTAHQQVSEQPRPLSQAAPEEVFLPVVEELVMRALAKGKAERFASMADFEAAIESTKFDDESTMAMVRPTMPPPLEEADRTVIRSMPPPSMPEGPAGGPAAAPPAKSPLAAPIVTPRRTRTPAPPAVRRVAPPPTIPPPEPRSPRASVRVEPPEAADRTIIRAAPVDVAASAAAAGDDFVDRTVIRSAPELPGGPSAAIPEDPTRAIRRPEPAAVGGTVVVQSPLSDPPSLPEFDEDPFDKTRISAPALDPTAAPPRMPPPQVPPPQMPPPQVPPPQMPSPQMPSPHQVPPPQMPSPQMPPPQMPPPQMPPAASPALPPQAGVFQSPPAAHPPRVTAPPLRPQAAPGRAFVADAPLRSVGGAAPPGSGLAPLRDDARPVFAKEQNANLMAAHLAPQRLSAPAAPANTDLSPEQALRTPFGAGTWTSTEDTNVQPDHSGMHDGGDFLLRPPEREVSRNLLVAVVIISVLGLAALSFVGWTMFREDPEYSVSQPHPATMAGQPKPAQPQAPPAPEGPRFPEPEPVQDEDDDYEPPPTRGKPAAPRQPKIVELNKAQLDDGFSRARAAIDACARTHGAIAGTSLQVSFDVVDSRARNAKSQPPHNLTPLGKCVAAAVNTHARFLQSQQPSRAISRKVSF